MDQKQSSLKPAAIPELCKDLNLVKSGCPPGDGEREECLGRKPSGEADFAPDLEELRDLRSFEDHPTEVTNSQKGQLCHAPGRQDPWHRGPEL